MSRDDILKGLFDFIGTKTRDAQIKEVDDKGLWGADLVDSNDLIADYIEKREKQAVEQTLKYVKEKLKLSLIDIIPVLLDSLITTEANKE